jgi:ketosteroid isomerase-like protein
MSQENVDLLYRWYEAFRRHDNEACVRDSARDVEIVSYLLGIEGTVYKGHVGMRRYIDQVFGTFPDWHAWVVRTIDHGDTVIAEIRMAGRGAGSGLEIEQTTWQVTRFREGKMAGFTAYGDRAAALKAVGLAE